MQNRNISDIIERYLKSILAEASQVEIKRSEVADQFDCVPSRRWVYSDRQGRFDQ